MSPYNSCRIHPVKALLTLFLIVVSSSFLFPDLFPTYTLNKDVPFPKHPSSHGTEKPTWAQWNPPHAPTHRHDYLPTGLLKTNMRGEHPMLELIVEGERKWKTMLSRQSKTLEEAVSEYKHRYGRSPPRGFDEWYTFAVKHNFLLIDEFDQIDRDITPLASFPYYMLKRRLADVKEISESSGFTITISSALRTTNASGPAFLQTRSRLLRSNILGFSLWLPDLEIYVNGNDRSPRLLGADMRQWIVDKKGEFTESQLQDLENVIQHGGDDIFSVCPVPPPPDFRVDGLIAQNGVETPNFIHDPAASSDFCVHPALAHLHGSLSIYLRARDPRLLPEFVWSKTRLNGEILLPFIENFHPFTLIRPHPWSEKTHEKLFWRGLATGSHHQVDHGGQLGWRGGSQRIRAATMFSNGSTFSKAPWVSSTVPLLIPKSSEGLETKDYPRAILNQLYTDIGLVGKPLQCQEDDGTCAEMAAEVLWRPELTTWGTERGKWKYVLDLDGNGLSTDLHLSLGLGSVVLKSSIFAEWNSDWLVPYYHYIPIQQDFSDVLNVMAFFTGSPSSANGDMEVDKNRGHDHLAEKIGKNAEQFVRQMWRWEDMQVYIYRLLLEYARIVSDDRGSMDYEG